MSISIASGVNDHVNSKRSLPDLQVLKAGGERSLVV